MIPSCVPATAMETSGALLTAARLKPLLKEPWAIGLAEMMNFPGVIFRDPEVLKKIESAKGKRIDGHAPFLSGKGLNAYLSAGIRSDHECTTPAEAMEKLSGGMWVMVREGTTARNLKDLLPLVTEKNSRRFFFVTDDRHPRELLEEGHIDDIVRKAIRSGLDPILAIQMATLNAAEYFRLDDLGAIGPGFRADLVVFDDLSRFSVKQVFKDGRRVVEGGRLLLHGGTNLRASASSASRSRTRAVKTGPLRRDAFLIPHNGQTAKVIQIIPDQIITKKLLKEIPVRDGIACSSIEQDILKIAVVERHRGTGNVGIGFVQGFGLKEGAIGSTVAHDSHNLVIVGTNDRDMLEAAKCIRSMSGGLAVVSDGVVTASLPLPVAGLMADTPVEEVHAGMERLFIAAKMLGCVLPDPFMTLSFLSLPVIPELKITDRGLVDVNQFKIVPLFGEE
jgi:adenine deaminase